MEEQTSWTLASTYKAKQNELSHQKLEAQAVIDRADEDLSNWRVKVENVLDYSKAMADKFESGDKEVKHQVLIKISSDLLYTTQNPLIVLKKEYNAVKKLNNGEYLTDAMARTPKYADVFALRPDLVPTDTTWLPG